MYFDQFYLLRMVGFIPREFEQFPGEGDIETVFLCDKDLVPDDIPAKCLFLAKEKAQFHDFTQLFEFFGESFDDRQLSVIVFCLGSNDISHYDKQLNFNERSETLDFHVTINKPFRYVSQCFTSLLGVITERPNVGKIISFDAMSRTSSGHHNSGVEYVNKRMEKINDRHAHYNTWKRFQRDLRRKLKKGQEKTKDRNAPNFPLVTDRFHDDGRWKEEEKYILAIAAVQALSSENDLVVDDARFVRKF